MSPDNPLWGAWWHIRDGLSKNGYRSRALDEAADVELQRRLEQLLYHDYEEPTDADQEQSDAAH